MKLEKLVVIMILASAGHSFAFTCQDLKPEDVFVTERLRTNDSFASAMKQYACSQAQFSDRDASRLGLNLPLAEGVLGFRFGQDSFSAWKQQNCQGMAASQNSASYLSLVRTFADPNKIHLLLSCKQLEADLEATGLQCSLTQPDPNSPLHTMLRVRWRPASDTDTRPTIQSVQMDGLSCREQILDKSVPTGGLQVICDRPTEFKPSTLIVRASNGQACNHTIRAMLTTEQKETQLLTRWETMPKGLPEADLVAVRCLQARETVKKDLEMATADHTKWETCSSYVRQGRNDMARACFRATHAFNATPPAPLGQLRAAILQAVDESDKRLKGAVQQVEMWNKKRCIP